MAVAVAMAMGNSRGRSKTVAAAVLGACALFALVDQFSFETSVAGGISLTRVGVLPLPRRSLLADADEAEDGDGGGGGEYGAVYPWARSNLRAITAPPDPKDTFLFWHIPKSGGSTAKAVYRCFGKQIDIESQPKAILEAKEMGVAESSVEIIFSSFPDFAIQKLFYPAFKGRAMAMFRHPVDRLVSKFYYLQIAHWEKSYRPQWKDMDVLEWARVGNIDNDHMVKKLAGKKQKDEATPADLRAAKRTLRARFVVGLMDDMEESVRRFDAYMGVDERDPRVARCLGSYFGEDVKRKNSNSHPKVERGSDAWRVLAEKNALDLELYEYILELYDEQKELADVFAGQRAASEEKEEGPAAAVSA